MTAPEERPAAAGTSSDHRNAPEAPARTPSLRGLSHGPMGRVVLVPTTSRLADGDDFHERLAAFLSALVPLAIHEQAGLSEADFARVCAGALEAVTDHGDALIYGGPHRRKARARLVQAIAALARAEGGVTALGVHACITAHEGCPGGPPRRDQDRANRSMIA